MSLPAKQKLDTQALQARIAILQQKVTEGRWKYVLEMGFGVSEGAKHFPEPG